MNYIDPMLAHWEPYPIMANRYWTGAVSADTTDPRNWSRYPATYPSVENVTVSEGHPVETRADGSVWQDGVQLNPCPDCHGTGEIQLLTSTVKCGRCPPVENVQ